MTKIKINKNDMFKPRKRTNHELLTELFRKTFDPETLQIGNEKSAWDDFLFPEFGRQFNYVAHINSLWLTIMQKNFNIRKPKTIESAVR